MGSREGMNRSQATASAYAHWVETAQADLYEAEAAVGAKDLERLGTAMERSTTKMVATMHTAVPPIHYEKTATLAVLDRVRQMRASGLAAGRRQADLSDTA